MTTEMSLSFYSSIKATCEAMKEKVENRIGKCPVAQIQVASEESLDSSYGDSEGLVTMWKLVLKTEFNPRDSEVEEYLEKCLNTIEAISFYEFHKNKTRG